MAAAEEAPLLEVRDLRIRFRTRAGPATAVDGISFALRPGEVMGLLGESGCGKTVTSLSILRLLPAGTAEIEGRIAFRGRDLLALPEDEMRRLRGRQISMILQDPLTSLNPVFTIGRQLGETLALHRIVPRAGIRARAAELLGRLRIPRAADRLDDYPHQFSGGMRQRVVAAIALASEPQLLIADEPTTSLDVTVQAHFLRLLKALQRRSNLAILFVTHDLGVISRICDRAAVMYAGRIVEEAPVRRLFTRPAHPYTEGLIASLPRIEGRAKPLSWIPGQPPSPLERPAGCAFAARCPKALPICREREPPEIHLDAGHRAACWLHAGGAA